MIVRPTRRDVLRYGSAAALAALPAPAIAQAWPSQADQDHRHLSAGGLTDIFSRAYGEYVGQKLGQPVVVENKTGAAGAIGAEMVKAGAARRLHADVHQLDDDGSEQGAVQEAALRSRQGFRAGRLVQHRPSADRRQQGRAGQEHCGVRRLGARPQGVARDLRRRLLRPCRVRDAQPPLRAQDGGRALSWRGADVAGRGLGRRAGRERQLRLGERRSCSRARAGRSPCRRWSA